MIADKHKPAIHEYWRSYVKSLTKESENLPAEYQAWSFGNTPEMADQLGELVREGIETATSSLARWYEQGIEPYPMVGEYSIILDSLGRPMCIVQTIELSEHAFNEVGEDHAYLEGEGDRSLHYWREVHWKFFSEECREQGWEPREQIPVLCERFKLVYS